MNERILQFYVTGLSCILKKYKDEAYKKIY